MHLKGSMQAPLNPKAKLARKRLDHDLYRLFIKEGGWEAQEGVEGGG